MGAQTRRLVGDAAVVESADVAAVGRSGEPPVAWRLVDLVTQASLPGLVVDASHVGREAELGHLHSALDRGCREQRAVLLTVVGDAGVGKSRLAREFAETVKSGAQVVTGHCPAYGDGLTFWPRREIVRELIGGSGIDGLTELLAEEPQLASTAAQVAGAVGLTKETGRPGEVFSCGTTAGRGGRTTAAPRGRARRPPLGAAHVLGPGRVPRRVDPAARAAARSGATGARGEPSWLGARPGGHDGPDAPTAR